MSAMSASSDAPEQIGGLACGRAMNEVVADAARGVEPMNLFLVSEQIRQTLTVRRGAAAVVGAARCEAFSAGRTGRGARPDRGSVLD